MPTCESVLPQVAVNGPRLSARLDVCKSRSPHLTERQTLIFTHSWRTFFNLKIEVNFTWVLKQKFRRHTFFNKDQPNQDRWKRSEMFSSLLWEGKKNKTVVCVFRPKSCWAVFPTPSFFNQCVCVCVGACVCVDSRYQTLGCFSRPQSFFPSLFGRRSEEKDTSWAPCGIPQRLRLTCAAKKLKHTKGIWLGFLYLHTGKRDR